MPEDQSEVIAFLCDPATHDGRGVERIDTHCAHVFLAGDTAWKIKRAVTYDYLDFSTLDKRKAILEREFALNRRAAPSLYRGVVPIARDGNGRLALNGPGEVVEYALEMKRFKAEAQLDRLAARGGLSDALAGDLGAAVAAYHSQAEPRTENGDDLILEIIEELTRVFSDMHDSLGGDRVKAFEDRARDVHRRLAELLRRRTAEGRVRRCHSDLHLANLVMLDGRPVPFDALEFDERLGTCDTFYDIAFLLMDLLHRGFGRQANICLARYLRDTNDHGGLATLPLFLSIRAAIRAMVDIQTARATDSDRLVSDAATYLDEAIGFLSPVPPRLVAVGGLSGSGKTTLSRGLAPDVAPPPGAVHLRSDVERKLLLGADPLERLPAHAYDAETTRRVYARLFDLARDCLAAGHSALIDASFLEEADRLSARDLAQETGAVFRGLWLSAPPEILISRIAERKDDASDATAEVVRRQIERAPSPPDWPSVETSGAPEPCLDTARKIVLSD